MSQIAQALSKAKERTGLTAAPFMVPGAPAPKPVPTKPIPNTQRAWVVMLSIIMVVGGVAIWYSGVFSLDQFRSDDPVATTTSTATTQATSTNPATTTTTTGTTGTPAQTPVRTEIQDMVNSLLISAVMPGDQPRIMLQGRVVGVGQPVDTDLTFSGLKGDRLLFTDRDGGVYTRRY